MIPLKDLNPSRSFPVVNIALILTNIVVFIYQLSLPPRALNTFFLANAVIPNHVHQFLAGYVGFKIAFFPLVTSMFLHGGFAHIIGNMLFLYIFGDNVEDYFGHLGYLVFYFFCGIGSGLLHILFNFHSNAPAIGASGAISGVMGAYIVLYPRAKVLTLFFIILIPIPAFIILGYWFALQFLEALSEVGTRMTSGVAVWAHVGGFLLGVLVTLLMRKTDRS